MTGGEEHVVGSGGKDQEQENGDSEMMGQRQEIPS